MPQIFISAPLNPTENLHKVEKAILNLFPDASIIHTQNKISATSKSVVRFSELLRTQRIRDAARSILLRNMRGTKTEFNMNKQVAYIGKISFAEGRSILGDIFVSIKNENLESLINEIAPETTKLMSKGGER